MGSNEPTFKIPVSPDDVPEWRSKKKKEKRKVIFGNPTNAPLEIRWLHANLSFVEDLVGDIKDEDFKRIVYAARLNLIGAHLEYQFKASSNPDVKPLDQSDDIADKNITQRLGGYLVSLFAWLPKGSGKNL